MMIRAARSRRSLRALPAILLCILAAAARPAGAAPGKPELRPAGATALAGADQRLKEARQALAGADAALQTARGSAAGLTGSDASLALARERAAGRDWQAAKDRVDDLQFRRDTLAELAKVENGSSKLDKVSPEGIQWLSGERELTPQERAAARQIVQDHPNYGEVVKDFQANKIAPEDMAKVVSFRKEEVDRIYDQAMRNVEGDTGVRLERQALGSTKLTSDYDQSVKFSGSEKVVGEFNDLFRKEYGRESGTVFDANAYTVPAYTFADKSAGAAAEHKLTTRELDDLRQFTYDQMAAAKYMSPDQYAAHAKQLVDGAPPELKDVVQHIVDKAQATNAASQRAIAQKMRDILASDPAAAARIPDPAKVAILDTSSSAQARAAREAALHDPAVKDLELHATNDLYKEHLEDIHLSRQERDRLNALDLSGKNPTPQATPPTPSKDFKDFLAEHPTHENVLRDIQQRIDAGDLDGARALRDQKVARLESQMRDTQGKSLYFASEAYQTEGAYKHVVEDLQGGARNGQKRSIDLQSLLEPPPEKPLLDPGRYTESLRENQANMFKELHHFERDPTTGEYVDPTGLAEKTSKYFVRQLDAARQSGTNLADLARQDAGTGTTPLRSKIIEATVLLNDARGDRGKVAAAFDKLGITPKQYVEGATRLSDTLAVETLKNSPLRTAGQRLADYKRQSTAADQSASADERLDAMARRKPQPVPPPEEMANRPPATETTLPRGPPEGASPPEGTVPPAEGTPPRPSQAGERPAGTPPGEGTPPRVAPPEGVQPPTEPTGPRAATEVPGQTGAGKRPGSIEEQHGGKIGLGVGFGIGLAHEYWSSYKENRPVDLKKFGITFGAGVAGFEAAERAVTRVLFTKGAAQTAEVVAKVGSSAIPLPGPGKFIAKVVLTTAASIIGHVAAVGAGAAVENSEQGKASPGFKQLFFDALKNTDWVDVVGSSTFSSVGTVVGGIVGFLVPIPGGTIIGSVLGGIAGDAVWSFGYDTYKKYGWKGVGFTSLGFLAGLGFAPFTFGLSPWIGAAGARWLYGKLWGDSPSTPPRQAAGGGPPGGPPANDIAPVSAGTWPGRPSTPVPAVGNAGSQPVGPSLLGGDIAPVGGTSRGGRAPTPTGAGGGGPGAVARPSPSASYQNTIVNPYLIQP